jgi:Fe2+ or Zn2+ uptake regulation protein
MAIDRADRNSNYVVSCDECGEEMDVTFDDFADAVASLKAEGWKFRKDESGNWEHFCPDCKEKADV